MTGVVEVISSGLYSSIQDLGRFGFRRYGVPVSGVMDEQSASMANHLLNNAPAAAVMEITMTGPKLLFSINTQIAISGADLSPQLNGEAIPLNKIIKVSDADMLSFGKLKYGLRCYLAVKGGFQTEVVMNSRSYFAPVTKSSIVQKGARLRVNANDNSPYNLSYVKTDPSFFTQSHLPCLKGPEFGLLTAAEQKLIFSRELSVSQENNRMGYRLEGFAFQYPTGHNMLTSAVLPGTVQLTPSGNLIALMKDCQTTGGYPRIIQLSQEGINKLAQKKTSDRVSFSLEERG
ncbi:MAG TPA: biotin-dependent carboxyltransferase family protein [Cyclobacteriaceae bacterium]|nr:biotin-dependent carboxyltransferase family protein [Cyclobacteriaceae bacterium]